VAQAFIQEQQADVCQNKGTCDKWPAPRWSDGFSGVIGVRENDSGIQQSSGKSWVRCTLQECGTSDLSSRKPQKQDSQADPLTA
jgi:hypothetical protein